MNVLINQDRLATAIDQVTQSSVFFKDQKETIINPDISYYTKAEVNELIPDLSGYALKTEIPTVPTNVSAFNNDVGYLTEIPSEYVTETELESKGYLTEHQSLEGYAKTTDIPDVSKYQTEEQVNALINTALGVIENGTY